MTKPAHCFFVVIAIFSAAASAQELDIVLDAKPVATIVIDAPEIKAPPARGTKKTALRSTPGDAMAAQVLVDWVRKISAAELPVSNTAPEGRPAIFIGQAAIKAGLTFDGIDSPTKEGVRIIADTRRILIAGQDPASTVKAVCRLLEELGCRYFMDSPLGEVYPKSQTIRVKPLDLREKPGMAIRQIWGSNWGGHSLWKIWNGEGGLKLGAGHAWGRYVPKNLFDTHPEYFALRNGERKKGDWYCTSNPELRKIFAENILKTLGEDGASASISPPDGVSYCECERCRAQDDPKAIEPSSGRVCVSNRYADFFNDVARQVRAQKPDAKLSFYCYADYTQAPTGNVTLDPALIPWVAPLRYCRMHAIGSSVCPSRVQLQQMLDGWSKAVHKSSGLAYRTYNYNLAECLVPYSMVSVWKHDIPYLKQHGAIGINNETLPSWQIYGPHIFLSLKLAYAPDADADAIMEDYFAKFFGPGAGPLMKQYWTNIDRAFAEMNAHAGSFYAIHRVYTPQFLAQCRKLLDDAAAQAKDDPAIAPRIAMFSEGMQNAAQYIELRDALNKGLPAKAKEIYQQLLTRTEAQVKAGYSNHYTPSYLKRFVGKHVETTADVVATGKVVAVLPDQWKLEYDEPDKGLDAGYAKPDFDDSKWKTVATFSDTLDSQGLPDRKTIMWYRTTVPLPALGWAHRPKPPAPSLLFVEVDGIATVFINGKEVGSSAKKRSTFEVDASELREGKNTIVIRVDHSGITELFLGGIIRPVYVVEKHPNW